MVAWLRFQIVHEQHLAVLESHVLEALVQRLIGCVCSFGGIHVCLRVEHPLRKIRCDLKLIRGIGMAK